MNFFSVTGLERSSESDFVALAMGVLDGHTFLFAGNGEGQVYQVIQCTVGLISVTKPL